ncbi:MULTISPECIES: hypothetical protein [unclassified Streptococcus]|uniref:hypothetical protein n=1 Tax=unclassified Streptococcus TaxID=2608887 RepID=UPI001D1679CB|nr:MULTISPECIES: hypothetical protein [unclassified Streptococcus]
MIKRTFKAFKDIFICHLLMSLIIFLIINKYFCGDINFIPRYISLLFLVIISISYFILSKFNPLDRKEDKNRFALIIRNVFFRVGIVILFTWLKILFSSFGFEISTDFQELFFLLLSYQFIFSLMAIVLGIKFISLFFIMVIAFPIMIVLGVFEIKWWALITGFITLWNYLNSEDFYIFLEEVKSYLRFLKS